MLNESFSERLKRMIYCLDIKCGDVWVCLSFTTKKEADKYRAMYPNKKFFLHASYLYEKADDAIEVQKLKLMNLVET